MSEMSKLKVCMIFNGAPDYRRAIYQMLDDVYDCEWYFIKTKSDSSANEMNLNLLKNVHTLNEFTFVHEPLSYQTGLLKLLFDKKYDKYFIAGSLWSLGIWSFCIAKKLFLPKKQIYFWTHGILRVREWPMNVISKLFFKLPDGIFTYGDRARSVMIGEGFEGNKIWPVHNSLDYDVQKSYRNNFSDIYIKHFGNNDPVFFFIGRLTVIKKLDMLVDAFKMLLDSGYNANLVFIGDGPVKDLLLSKVTDYDISDLVWFYGKCYNEREKSELIANADLCVAPGNIGLTAMDSLVYGTPCLTMDNYGKQMPEHEAILEGVTGSFFKEDDVEDLAKRMIAWLNNGMDRDDIRKNCYNMIDNNWNPYFQIKVIKEHLR